MTNSIDKHVEYLSGGNQQKVVVAKWLCAQCDLILFDEPTRGIDVGAREEIYEIMNALVKQGKAVLMISSDMPELLGLCDRIYVDEGRQSDAGISAQRSDTGEAAGVQHLGRDGYETEKTELPKPRKAGAAYRRCCIVHHHEHLAEGFSAGTTFTTC